MRRGLTALSLGGEAKFSGWIGRLNRAENLAGPSESETLIRSRSTTGTEDRSRDISNR